MSESENIVPGPTAPNLASESVQNLIPQKKKFPLLLYISLILLSVVSVISIYLFLQVRQLTLEKLAPSPTPIPSPSADPTAGWQTYTNDLFSFNLKYPAGFSLTDNLQESLDPLAWTTKNTLTLTDSGNDCTILLMINPDGFGPWFPNKTITVGSNGLDGLSVIAEKENTENLAEKKYQIIATGSISDRKVSGLWVSATCSDTPQDKDYLDATVDEILSTFKFTDNSTSELPKKHFVSSNKFFDTYPYPVELTNLKDVDLIGFSCSDKYSKQLNNSFTYYNNLQQNKPEELTDKQILEYLNTNRADEVMVCKTDTGRTLLSYGVFGKGGGVGSATYYGYFEGNNPSVATIPMENGPYFTCGTILAITKSNTLYVECASGDGGFGSKSLYRVGLYKAYTSDLLLKCTTTMQDESSTPKITCGTTQ